MLFLMTVLAEISLSNITCDTLLGSDKKPTLFTLQSANISKIIECQPVLGKMELPYTEAIFIWQSFVQYFDGISNIPESVLMTLGWVTPAINASEYTKLSLGDIDVVRNFGRDYHLSKDQLSAIADRVREDFAGKQPEDYTCYDLIALRNVICAFNVSEIGRIHASAYKEAAMDIGKLKCGPKVMSAFAKLAVHHNAFGPHLSWSDEVINNIGEVAKYLPKDFSASNNNDSV